MKISSFIAIIFLLFNLINAQSISVTGQWNYTIPTIDITEAGEDFIGTYTSSINQVYLDIIFNNRWAVSVQKNDIDWDNRLRIFVHRTGNGSGIGRINGGQNYRRINNQDFRFITGRNNRNSIPIQYQMRNVSVTLPAYNYVTEILYTLTAR